MAGERRDNQVAVLADKPLTEGLFIDGLLRTNTGQTAFVAGRWFNRHMIDVGWVLETWRAARWEAIVMIWNAIVADVIAYPWFAVVVAALVVSAGAKGLSKLARYVGGAYWSSPHWGRTLCEVRPAIHGPSCRSVERFSNRIEVVVKKVCVDIERHRRGSMP